MSGVVPHEGNDRDAGVVEEICGYLTEQPPRSFFLFAGAGSGKTRTLVEALRRLTGVVPHESGGRLARQLRLKVPELSRLRGGAEKTGLSGLEAQLARLVNEGK